MNFPSSKTSRWAVLNLLGVWPSDTKIAVRRDGDPGRPVERVRTISATPLPSIISTLPDGLSLRTLALTTPSAVLVDMPSTSTSSLTSLVQRFPSPSMVNPCG
jgi:hypothetical protein